MKPRVDQDVCIGTANCVAVAPSTFQLNNKGLSEVINPQGDSEDLIRQAAEECPVQAIIIEDDNGNQIYP